LQFSYRIVEKSHFADDIRQQSAQMLYIGGRPETAASRSGGLLKKALPV
jgi:hypothetical protein